MADLRSMDDASLLAAEERIDEAWRAFFDRYKDPVFDYFAALHVPRQDAADLVQDTFFAAFRSRRSYRPEKATALTWLLGIAEKKLADRGRRFGRQEKMMRDLQLERIPLTQRDVLNFDDGEDYDEIAQAQGTSKATARKRLSRTLSALRRRLREDEE